MLRQHRELTTCLSVGGIHIGLSEKADENLPPQLRPFVTTDAQPEVFCRGSLGPIPPPSRSEENVFDSGGVWCVNTTPTGLRLVLRKQDPPGRPYHVLDLSTDLTQGIAHLDPSGMSERAPFLLREPMHELWTSFLLMRDRGLLVHACGVLTRGGVHLFAGKSGAGKSTLAGLLEREGIGEVLSDDRLILRKEEDGFRVYGTPWHGEERHASPLHGLLASVNMLSKDTRSYQEEIQPKQAVTGLLQTCFLAGWPRSGLDFVLGTCVEVCTRHPCRRLHFRPDVSAVETAGLS